jgi:hypothetical protein
VLRSTHDARTLHILNGSMYLESHSRQQQDVVLAAGHRLGLDARPAWRVERVKVSHVLGVYLGVRGHALHENGQAGHVREAQVVRR